MITCPKCGHENSDNATNCASCRINLEWATHNMALKEQEMSPPVSPSQATPFKFGFRLGGNTGAVLGFVSGLVFQFDPDPNPFLGCVLPLLFASGVFILTRDSLRSGGHAAPAKKDIVIGLIVGFLMGGVAAAAVYNIFLLTGAGG